MIEFVSTFWRLRQLLLLGCFLITFSVPWWGGNVQANAAIHTDRTGVINRFQAPAAQISPLSPLESPLETDTPEPPPLPTVEPTPTLSVVESAPVAPASIGGPLYSGVAANQVSPMLVGALIVALLGVGAIVFTRQR